MRNLHILTRASAKLRELDPSNTVTAVCLDEFGQQLFAYTLNHRLLVFKYRNPRDLEYSGEYTFEEFQDNGVLIVSLEYI